MKLESVRRVVCVHSGKGGVGKSTVAVNFACSLARMGLKVGLLDADLYGPSLPTMLSTNNPDARVIFSDCGLYANPVRFEFKTLESEGGTNAIRYLSVAHFKEYLIQRSDESGALTLRGGVISQLVRQMICGTAWNGPKGANLAPLDYLVVDMPPGTGDVQLQLCRNVHVDGVIVVTTPQRVSAIDGIKGQFALLYDERWLRPERQGPLPEGLSAASP
eukprot:5830263-Pyramimonas_sp.AAC.1